MGNWRRVHIVGICEPTEVPALVSFLFAPDDDWDTEFGPLSIPESPSLLGLGVWPASRIDRIGNLYERGFTPDDVADHLRRCVVHAPSLAVKVHCGASWEAEQAVATITVADGQVTVAEPEVTFVPEVPQAQVMGNFRWHMVAR
jgi:hypothetical protein